MALYVLDTGVLLHYARATDLARQIDQEYAPSHTPNIAVVSVVTVAEILSMAMRRKWGNTKLQVLHELLRKFPRVDINQEPLINKYAEIDAYRTNKHPTRKLPDGVSSRALGDNDIWIAATAAITRAKLITLDEDFGFLDKEFLDVIYIPQSGMSSKAVNPPESIE